MTVRNMLLHTVKKSVTHNHLNAMVPCNLLDKVGTLLFPVDDSHVYCVFSEGLT